MSTVPASIRRPAPDPDPEPTTKRRSLCAELRAMQRVDDALAELSPEECVRALRWIWHKWDRPLVAIETHTPATPPEGFP